MPLFFEKTRDCGCVVNAVSCEVITLENNEKMYSIGGHTHAVMCEKCNADEANGIDTLYDMWTNDNLTNNHEHAGWKQKNVMSQLFS
jgi:hypothetical protein